MNDTAAQAVPMWTRAASAAILALCLAGLLAAIIKKRRKRRGIMKTQSPMEDCAPARNLPAEADLADGEPLIILKDIIYCESREIIL